MKKCLCLLLSLTMLCLCAGAALAETVALKVWGSQEDQELLAELCEAFAAEHPETTYEFTYGVVGEADAKARYLEDPAAAADVFSYPDDQIIDLVNADALYEVTRNHDAIVAANSVGSLTAASVGGVLYGYPMTPITATSSITTVPSSPTRMPGPLTRCWPPPKRPARRSRSTFPMAGISRASSWATAARSRWMKTATRSATSTAKRACRPPRPSAPSATIPPTPAATTPCCRAAWATPSAPASAAPGWRRP